MRDVNNYGNTSQKEHRQYSGTIWFGPQHNHMPMRLGIIITTYIPNRLEIIPSRENGHTRNQPMAIYIPHGQMPFTLLSVRPLQIESFSSRATNH
jgi:hypothetical protein